jgi:hypothetical protein
MKKPISRSQHGFTDYSYIPTVFIAPKLVGFEDEEKAVLMTRVLSGTILLSSMVTRAEWGVFKKMPYKAHLALDMAGGGLALVSPWVFGFADNKKARNTFLVAGLFGLMAGLLSRPEEMPKGR